MTLVCGGVLGPYLHPRVRRSVAKRLSKLGVTVLEGPDAKVTAVTCDTVQLGDGRALPSAVTIWAAGFAVPDLATRSGLSTDTLGRLLTDETLTSVDDERIVAAGDSAAPSDMPLRMSCQTARPLGAHAADTVLARITGVQPKAINVGFFGQCIGLGRRAATVQIASKDDTANRYYIGGRLAAGIKERACTGVVKPREPVDPACIGGRVVRRRAKGMDAGAVAAALEDARFDARQASRFEDLADEVRGLVELAEVGAPGPVARRRAGGHRLRPGRRRRLSRPARRRSRGRRRP
ncbi:hypothetical protein SCANM63S_09019 [Streptomyces canarius]